MNRSGGSAVFEVVSLSPPLGYARRYWTEKIEARPIQFSVKSLLATTTCVAALLLLFRYVPTLGVFVAMCLPFCVALWLRRQILATPVLHRTIVRLPLFIVIFGAFYCAMLGPFTTLVSMTNVRTDRGRAEIATIAVYAPLFTLCSVAPSARDYVENYLDWWDLSR